MIVRSLVVVVVVVVVVVIAVQHFPPICLYVLLHSTKQKQQRKIQNILLAKNLTRPTNVNYGCFCLV